MAKLKDQLVELGVQVDAQLFDLAFTHRSYAFENGRIESNERLEFLGDAVLQIVVTEYIYTSYPDLPEGQLAKLRASVVSSHALAEVARDLELGELIKLGKGEIATKGNTKTSILADTMEAVIGAIHLSAGPQASAKFLHAVFDERIVASHRQGDFADFKTVLQELCAQSGWGLPVYQITGEGPDHQRVFSAEVLVAGNLVGQGTAPSKKRAEQLAAKQACQELGR